MSKILIISQWFYPENFRINDICFELVKKGHDVTVLTGLPNYPKGDIFPGYENKKKMNEIVEGVKIVRVNEVPRKHNSVNLFFNYMSFMCNASRKVKKIKDCYDYIFVNQVSPVFQIRPGIIAKKKNKCPLIVYCYDLWPEALKVGGIGEKNIAYKIIGNYCKKLYNSADLILNTTESFADYLHNKNNVPYEKIKYLPQPYSKVDQYINYDKVPDDKVDLLFAGNIGKVQNVSDIVEAYNILRNPNLYIHIFGDGSEFDKIKQLVEQYDISKNVILYGNRPLKEVNDFYKKVDACLLTLSGKNDIGLTAPAKLSGYMMAGKMVIAAAKGDTCKILDKAQCGIHTKPDDYKALAILIEQYINNKNKYEIYGENGRNYFKKNLTIEKFLDDFEKIMKEIK